MTTDPNTLYWTLAGVLSLYPAAYAVRALFRVAIRKVVS